MSSSRENITNVLESTLPSDTDTPVLEYLTSVIAEEDIKTTQSLYETLGEILVMYELVADDKQAKQLCQKIGKQLFKGSAAEAKSKAVADVGGGNEDTPPALEASSASSERKNTLQDDPDTTPSARTRRQRRANRKNKKQSSAGKKAVAEEEGLDESKWRRGKESDRHDLFRGLSVLALYYEDKKWYPASIQRVVGEKFLVQFTQYGNEEEVKITDMKIPVSHSLESKVSADADDQGKVAGGFKIADTLESKVRRRRQNRYGNNTEDEDKGPSKRDLKRIAAFKALDQAMAKKEALRVAESERKQEEAFERYLAAERTGKTMDVDIKQFQMSTPDGSAVLIQDAYLRLVPGHRYGLVGRNGIGKTTLMRHIADYDLPHFPEHLLICHVEQEAHVGDIPVREAVIEGDRELALLRDEEKKLLAYQTGGPAEEDEEEKPKLNKKQKKKVKKEKEKITEEYIARRLVEVYDRMKQIGANTADARAAQILGGLGFSESMQLGPTSALSGGWRMRLALARALFVNPDILLLDEPTNHLDFPAVLWLQEYLQDYQKTLIVVSHDREFLAQVTTDIVLLKSRELTYYVGDYIQFEKTRKEQLKKQRKDYEAQKMKREHIEAFINKFRYNAKRASLVQSRIKELARMEVLEDVVDESLWHFEFPVPEKLKNAQALCNVQNVHFGYSPERKLLNDVSFSVTTTSRIGILGANGVGKSTLLNLILKKIVPQQGSIRVGEGRIANFSQHHADAIDLNQTPMDVMSDIVGPKVKEEVLRSHLGRFGINGDLALQRIRFLSGGQKSRVAFALITWKRPHLLILDEPTNHLDLETIDALIEAIQGYKGGVIIVSHDQYFVKSTVTDFWGLSNGALRKFNTFEGSKKFTYGNMKN